MIIRKMELGDYEAVNELMRQLNRLHTENRSDLFLDIDPYSRAEFDAKIADTQCVSILAEEKGMVLGICFVSLCPEYNISKKRFAYMDDLIVSEHARRKGVATRLFQAAAQQVKALGAEHLNLKVWEFNSAALAFYRSLGMTVQSYILETPL